MERSSSLGNIDSLAAVVGTANTADAKLPTQFSRVVIVDGICPFLIPKCHKKRFRHLTQRQQVVVDIDSCPIFQRNRRRRSLHGQVPYQNRIKQLRRFAASYDLGYTDSFPTKRQLPCSAETIFKVRQLYAILIEYTVIDRDFGCGKSAFIGSAATELRIACEECSFTQPAFSIGLLHSAET